MRAARIEKIITCALQGETSKSGAVEKLANLRVHGQFNSDDQFVGFDHAMDQKVILSAAMRN